MGGLAGLIDRLFTPALPDDMISPALSTCICLDTGPQCSRCSAWPSLTTPADGIGAKFVVLFETVPMSTAAVVFLLLIFAGMVMRCKHATRRAKSQAQEIKRKTQEIANLTETIAKERQSRQQAEEDCKAAKVCAEQQRSLVQAKTQKVQKQSQELQKQVVYAERQRSLVQAKIQKIQKQAQEIQKLRLAANCGASEALDNIKQQLEDCVTLDLVQDPVMFPSNGTIISRATLQGLENSAGYCRDPVTRHQCRKDSVQAAHHVVRNIVNILRAQ